MNPQKEYRVDERIARLDTPEECEQFAINVAESLPELAKEARRKAVQLRAAQHGAESQAEQEALQAVYAYERAKSKQLGKKFRASRTWPMIKKHGIIEAVERVVKRTDVTTGYTVLVEMGMQDFAFEAVVCRHPNVFSPEALKRSQERLAIWNNEKCI